MKFEGIYTPAITPHGPDGEIDREAFAEVLESLIAAGVHGIIIGGSTGEYYAPLAAGAVRPRGLCQGGDRHPPAADRRHRRDPDRGLGRLRQGGPGDRRTPSSSPRRPMRIPTERENAVHALTIDRAADLPIMLYNYPGRMGVSMGEEYFARVGRSRNVVAIKESSGDTSQCTCWRGASRTSRSVLRLGRPGARVLRLGRAELGLRRVELPARRSTSRSTRPASSRRTSTRAGGS